MNPKNVRAEVARARTIDADASLSLVEDADRFVQRIRKYLVEERVLEAKDQEHG